MARLVTASLILFLVATAPAHADPISIGVFVAGSLGYLVTAPVAYLIGGSVLLAAGVGVSLLSAAINRPPAPSPQERQATLRQSVGPRVRYYGRVLVGGTVAFFEARSGMLYQLTTVNWGRIQGFVQTWFNDDPVNVDGNGWVQTEPYNDTGGFGGITNPSVARVLYKDGSVGQTAHSILVNAFPQVDSSFRLRNMANCLVRFEEVDQEDIGKYYPNLNPQIRNVIDASLCERVRQEDIGWSDNPADVIYDYLVGRDGAGFPWGAGYNPSQINLDSFKEFADTCDEMVPLSTGGSIKRYRLWGGYSMNEEVRDVVARFASSADGDVYLDTDGKIAIRGGKWVPPQLTLDADKGHILSADFRHGRGSLAAFNELTITYTEPSLEWQETECDPWIDAVNVDIRGKALTASLSLSEVPHFAQARRLGKIHTYKNNPEWVGTVVTNFYGMNAIGENMVHIRFPLLGIDLPFRIVQTRILDDVTGVEIQVASLPAAAYSWDPALEDGTPPGEPPNTSVDDPLLPPEDLNVSAASRDTGVFLVATWTPHDRTALSVRAQYRSSPDGTWIDMLISDGSPLAESGLVSSGIAYDVRARTQSPGGNFGDWSPLITVTATPNTTPAADVTDVAGLTWTMSASDWSIGARIYRNTADDVGTATLVATVYGSPGTPGTYVDTPPAGVYYYWIASWTGSFVEGGLVPTGALTVG